MCPLLRANTVPVVNEFTYETSNALALAENHFDRHCCRNCFSGYNPPVSSSNILSASYS
jgi:hypothetical protein